MANEKTKQEANEILRHLGGNRFSLMTGAKNFGFSETIEGNTCLEFSIGKNHKSINQVSIVLNGLDLYDLKFIKRRWITKKAEYEFKTISENKNIYCDQLKEIFESSTGLYTSLGTMGK